MLEAVKLSVTSDTLKSVVNAPPKLGSGAVTYLPARVGDLATGLADCTRYVVSMKIDVEG
jgi:hypothetical protein